MLTPTPVTPWVLQTPQDVARLLDAVDVRWWLSGGVALDHWLGRKIQERGNTDVSTTSADVARLVDLLPERFSAWVAVDEVLTPWNEVPEGVDVQPVSIHDDQAGTWVLRVNVEDGIQRAWLYRRDPRLQLPWERAVLDVGGIPTGAPEVQLVWKALRPRPQDDVDKDAVLPALSEEARAWWERSILSVHPHSTWSIHLRSPFAPAKASWNRPRRNA
ncbi:MULTISPECIES: hypothetical protein [Arthrobacter]|uniref:Amino acid transporter n=2 Tax=Arthrobacter TaxID=1663 RepID=A0ABU9KLZ2_9MICC|nr:hypothetical protein [Arthrobacter sp. YJM1]MDP5228147.1 hypothetical protein [Arthrobacter sp. YJM1]